ncbi:hypothetical protein ACWEOE_31720 [Amycolatopsis sp. NPDC004368]
MNVKTHDEVVGTDLGYRWHKRNGSEPCDDCRAGHNERMARWRDSRKPRDAVATVRIGVLAEILDLLPARRRAVAAELLGGETASRVEHVKRMLSRPNES